MRTEGNGHVEDKVDTQPVDLNPEVSGILENLNSITEKPMDHINQD